MPVRAMHSGARRTLAGPARGRPSTHFDECNGPRRPLARDGMSNLPLQVTIPAIAFPLAPGVVRTGESPCKRANLFVRHSLRAWAFGATTRNKWPSVRMYRLPSVTAYDASDRSCRSFSASDLNVFPASMT